MARDESVGPIRDLTTRLRQWLSSEPVHTAGSSGIYSREQFQAALQREQARAERNGHRIALALLPGNGHNGDACRTSRLLEVLKGRLRVTDEAGWFSPSRIGVLMPYTSCEGAWHMIEDLCARMDGELIGADCRVYIYPYHWIDHNDEAYTHDIKDTRAAGRVKRPGAESVPAPPCDGSGHISPIAVDTADAGTACEAVACVYPIVAVPQSDPSAWQRGLDVALSLAGLILLAPVFLGTTLLIELVSPGPVLFKQVRIGRGGKPFMLWKFRTMAVNADSSIHENHVTQLINRRADNGEAASKPMTKLDNDPRVIPLGSVLRGACIDELPQLVNVLRGEMSLVGPRPPIPYEVRDYQPWQRRRLDAMPGLTGLWQVSGKNELTFDEMVRLDIQYSRKRSLWMNIMIMLRTPRAILEEIAGVWSRWKERAPENA